jgi:hypothetical protein
MRGVCEALVVDVAAKIHKHMSDNDYARGQTEYDRLVALGVDIKQFADARLSVGVAIAEAEEMGAAERYVKRFYYEDARACGYLPASITFETSTLDELRAAEETFYGHEFPPD